MGGSKLEFFHHTVEDISMKTSRFSDTQIIAIANRPSWVRPELNYALSTGLTLDKWKASLCECRIPALNAMGD